MVFVLRLSPPPTHPPAPLSPRSAPSFLCFTAFEDLQKKKEFLKNPKNWWHTDAAVQVLRCTGCQRDEWWHLVGTEVLLSFSCAVWPFTHTQTDFEVTETPSLMMMFKKTLYCFTVGTHTFELFFCLCNFISKAAVSTLQTEPK